MEDQLLGIFQLLDNPSLCQARLVCKYWKEVIDGSKRCWWLRIIDNELEVSRLSKVNPTWKKKAWRKMIKWIVRSSQNSYLALIQLGQTIQCNQKPNRGFSLIHYCAEMNFGELLDILLPYTKTKDTILDLGWQPLPLYFALCYAARDGHLNVLRVFVKHHGPDVFKDFQRQYPSGRLSPMYYAIRNDDKEMVDYLFNFPMPDKVRGEVESIALEFGLSHLLEFNNH